MQFIQESLEALNVKCKVGSPREDPDGTVTYRLRIGGYDRRKVMFKGWVDVEAFSYRGHKGSFCVMQRDVVSVISSFLNRELRTEYFYAIGQSNFVATIVEGVDPIRGG